MTIINKFYFFSFVTSSGKHSRIFLWKVLQTYLEKLHYPHIQLRTIKISALIFSRAKNGAYF